MVVTDAEREIAQRIGFSERVVIAVKQATGSDRLEALTRDEGEALLATAPRGTSEELLLGLRGELLPLGYLPFLLDRTLDFQERPDTIAVLKTTDPLAPVRFAGTDAGNYDLSNDDILRTLEGWRTVCEYDVLGAERDSLYLRFHTLPGDMVAFAAELYAFCPDLIDQGFGVAVEEARDYLPDGQQREVEQLFAADTGDEAGRAERVALRLLAKSIEEAHRLTLWWD